MVTKPRLSALFDTRTTDAATDDLPKEVTADAPLELAAALAACLEDVLKAGEGSAAESTYRYADGTELSAAE